MKFTLRGERVNFTDSWAKTKTRDEFIAAMAHVWAGVPDELRREELGRAWDMMQDKAMGHSTAGGGNYIAPITVLDKPDSEILADLSTDTNVPQTSTTETPPVQPATGNSKRGKRKATGDNEA